MASCWVLVALVLLSLTLVSAAISFVAPFWTEMPDENKTLGLWGSCHNNECTWFFQNGFSFEDQRMNWEKAVQGLFGFGLLTILVAFLIACIHLCCQCCRKAFSITHLVSGLLLFAFLELGVALVLYGVKANAEWDVTLDGSHRFAWGYWVGCIAALLDLVATFLYVCEGCRGGYSGYTRGEVV